MGLRQLPQRALGRTGLDVSILGLGTVKFGRTAGVRYAAPFELPSDNDIADLLATAQSLGINLLDTAPAYGRSEARLGAALAGQRDAWIVATKTGEEFDGVKSRFDFSADHTLRSVERSLVRLRTDRLDIVSIHSDGRDVGDIEAAGAIRALTRLRDQGTIHAIGFSGKTPSDGKTALAFADVLMCTINAGYSDENPLVRAAAHQGTGVLVKKPLERGLRHPQGLPAIAAVLGVASILVGTTSAVHLVENANSLRDSAATTRAAPGTAQSGGRG